MSRCHVPTCDAQRLSSTGVQTVLSSLQDAEGRADGSKFSYPLRVAVRDSVCEVSRLLTAHTGCAETAA
jgi:hypothetical protein